MLLLQTRNLFALKEGSPITKVTGMEQNTRDARGRNRLGSARRSPSQRKQDVIKWGSRLIPSAVASGRSEAAGEDVDAEAARGRTWKAFAGVRATRNEWNCSFIFFFQLARSLVHNSTFNWHDKFSVPGYLQGGLHVFKSRTLFSQ